MRINFNISGQKNSHKQWHSHSLHQEESIATALWNLTTTVSSQWVTSRQVYRGHNFGGLRGYPPAFIQKSFVPTMLCPAWIPKYHGVSSREARISRWTPRATTPSSYRESQGTPKWQYQLQQLHLSQGFSSTPLTTYDTRRAPSHTLQHQFVQEKDITPLRMGNVATPHECLHALFNHTLNFCRIVRCIFGGWVQDGEPCMTCWMSSMERICMICCAASCEGAHGPTRWSGTGHSPVYTPSLDLLLSAGHKL